MPIQSHTHSQQQAQSYAILEAARQKAAKKSGYDSHSTREQVKSLFLQRFGSSPREWQIDATEAILLGLDSIIVAGTGAGKTMPFMMRLLLDSSKKVIIISPLKLLEADQVERFKKMKLTAVAVNGETWNPALKEGLEADRYQAIFASPEMCLQPTEFRQVLSKGEFRGICAVIIDEAHCIAQWGGDFRPAYSELSKLRAFFPPHIPILATSATLPPAALREVAISLGINLKDCFFLNLGNDRPNIDFSVRKIDSADDVHALQPLLTRVFTPSTHRDLIKSIVFVNAVSTAQVITRSIRQWFPPHLRSYVQFLYAHRSPQAKRKVMQQFRDGQILLLVATEAAGMGTDIPDIEQVIQFGVPPSLTVWIQRAGRAGRSSNINARAILLAEKSMFERQKKRRRKQKEAQLDAIEDDEDGHNLSGGENETAPADDMEETFEWRKKCEEALREWIETTSCRRDVADRYFANPPHREAPTHACCDNCDGIAVDPRPSTPLSTPSSPPQTPSKSPDSNGKRKMLSKMPATRRGDHLQSARTALEHLRLKLKHEHYTPSPFTLAGILPDSVIKTFASNTSIKTVQDMKATVAWVFTERHGNEVIEVLKTVDFRFQQERDQVKQAKADE